MTPTFAVILPAAGTGNRFGSGDKLLVDLAGRSVLQRSVDLFASRQDLSHVLVVTAPDRIPAYRNHLLPNLATPLAAKLAFVPGGQHRWQSVLNGLRHLASLPAAPEFVAIHDAARPLCPQFVIDDAFRTTRERGGVGAALPCVPEPATLKRRHPDGTVAETVDRSVLFQAQTPQCFHLQKLLQGYEQLLTQNRVADLTDDAQVYERIGLPVPITPGSPVNLKITTAADVALACALLATS